MDIWNHVKSLVNRELKTLSKEEPFVVASVEEHKVWVVPEVSGKPRPISKEIIQGAWEQLSKDKRIDLNGIRKFIEYSPVYVASILYTLPNIEKIKEGR